MKWLKQNKANNSLTVTEKTAKRNERIRVVFSRLFGLSIILVSFSAYFASLPLTFMFLGGYMGVPSSDTHLSRMDYTIWLLSSIGILIPLLLVFIVWIRYVWKKFVIKADFFTLR